MVMTNDEITEIRGSEMKQIPGQIDLFQYLETIEHAEDPVRVKGAVNLKSHPISQYEVTLSYGDIVLIISMLRDYVRGLDEIKGDSIDWQAYYRNKFLGMADRMQQQVGYDYDKAVEKCRKKQEKKESRDDVGEDALILALKKSAQNKKSTEPEKVEESRNDGISDRKEEQTDTDGNMLHEEGMEERPGTNQAELLEFGE